MRQLQKSYRHSKTLMARINWKRARKNFHNSYKTVQNTIGAKFCKFQTN